MSQLDQQESTARMSARIKLDPKASQIVLIAAMGLATISLLVAARMLSEGNPAGWAFLAFTTVVFGSTLYAWKSAQSDTDLTDSHPTTVALANGTSLSTDSRTLRNPEVLKVLVQVLAMKPLPPAIGVVGPDGNVMPESEAQAIRTGEQINASVHQLSSQIMDAMHDRTSGPGSLQGPVDPSPIPPA
jgi:hypothetical protein